MLLFCRLDYFLVFFQHYYWYKKSHPVFSRVENTSDLFPILVDHMYRDCVANVRPKLKVFNLNNRLKKFSIKIILITSFNWKLYKNLEQAKEAIEKLKEELYPQLKAGMQVQAETDNNLEPIREDSELDDAVSLILIKFKKE